MKRWEWEGAMMKDIHRVQAQVDVCEQTSQDHFASYVLTMEVHPETTSEEILQWADGIDNAVGRIIRLVCFKEGENS